MKLTTQRILVTWKIFHPYCEILLKLITFIHVVPYLSRSWCQLHLYCPFIHLHPYVLVYYQIQFHPSCQSLFIYKSNYIWLVNFMRSISFMNSPMHHQVLSIQHIKRVINSIHATWNSFVLKISPKFFNSLMWSHSSMHTESHFLLATKKTFIYSVFIVNINLKFCFIHVV